LVTCDGRQDRQRLRAGPGQQRVADPHRVEPGFFCVLGELDQPWGVVLSGHRRDITLTELSIESFFPADEASRRAMAAAS